MAEQRHGFVAARTNGQRPGKRSLGQGRLPIQQGKDALPPGFGGGTEPAEIANALKAFGQDMLEKAAQELLCLQ